MNQKNYHIILLLIFIGILGACTPTEDVLVLPTVLELPSETPTATATATDLPTVTPTFTPSSTPTNTLTPPPTFTPFPTNAPPTATNTITPIPTDTEIPPTLTPGIIILSTSIITNTPEPTETPLPPVIVSFTSNVNTATPNSQIMLRWETQADFVRLETLNEQGGVIESTPVALFGTISVSIPFARNRIVYRLVATRNNQEASANLPIIVQCEAQWFFGVAPPESACPDGASFAVGGASQTFQRGTMVHLQINARAIDRVFILQNNVNRTYSGHDNLWDGASFTNTTPQPNLFEPQGVFNWAFYNTVGGSGGSWESVLGLGIEPINTNPITVQFGNDGSLFFRIPSGVYRLTGNLFNGQWIKIQ